MDAADPDRGRPLPAFGEQYFSRAYGGRCALASPPAKLLYHLEAVRRRQPGGRLLDVGCGYGFFLAAAAPHYEVEGCDVSAHALERARAALPGVPLHQAGAAGLSLPRSFDVITAFDSLEHATDLDAAFANLRRHLAPGGVLALTVPVYDGLPGAMTRLLDRDPTHVWKKGRGFWRAALGRHGFTPLDDVGLWRYFLLKRRYLFFASPRLREFSPALFLTARR
jgi:SAM-dependent methyltransferase